MNYFFGIDNHNLKCNLQIPKFQNRINTPNQYLLFKAKINNNKWEVKIVEQFQSNKYFFDIEKKYINNDTIFFLAKQNEVNSLNQEKLLNLNNFTDTTPPFRANLEVSIENGGFSSFQSDYPFAMTKKKGSIVTNVSLISNEDADKNFIFLKNIYQYPVNEKFFAYFVNLKTKLIEEKIELKTNYTNCIELKKSLIKPEIFLTTERFLGIPMYVSIKNKHISFEHTHPLHTYILSEDKYKKIEELKIEINEIIN
jgi:hypothetical protein